MALGVQQVRGVGCYAVVGFLGGTCGGRANCWEAPVPLLRALSLLILPCNCQAALTDGAHTNCCSCLAAGRSARSGMWRRGRRSGGPPRSSGAATNHARQWPTGCAPDALASCLYFTRVPL